MVFAEDRVADPVHRLDPPVVPDQPVQAFRVSLGGGQRGQAERRDG